MRRAFFLFFSTVVVLVLLVVPSFLLARTTIIHSWVASGVQPPRLQKILFIAVLENYLVRQQLEDEMEKLFARSGIHATKSHMVLPPRNEVPEAELKQRIKDSDFDAVLVIRPKDIRKETEETVSGPAYLPPPGYHSLGPYWSHVQAYHSRAHVQKNPVVRVEFNLYDRKNEGLLWGGESDTIYSKDFKKLGKSYAKALVKQMKRDGIIQ